MLVVASFEEFLILLIWVVWLVLNLWIWQKSKAQGNLLMMIGAALLAFVSLMGLFNVILGEGAFWLMFFGLVALTVGFFLSVKPMVAAQMAAIGGKLKNVTSPPPSSGEPPPKA
jgi:hypothetical protein